VALSKPSAAVVADVLPGPASDDWMSNRCPEVWAYLADTKYADGQPRATATLMVIVESGVVKVCLNDRDNDRSAWVSGRSFQEALEALEVGLVGGRTDWRARAPGRAPGKGRK